MTDPAEIARGWLVEEPFGPHIHWIALAEKSWPRVKPTYRYSSTTGDVIAEVVEYLTPIVRVKDASEALRFAHDNGVKLVCPAKTGCTALLWLTEHFPNIGNDTIKIGAAHIVGKTAHHDFKQHRYAG